MSNENRGTFSDGEFSLTSALEAVSQQGETQAVELKEKQHILVSLQATLSEITKRYEDVASDIKLKERQITDITCESGQIHNHTDMQETQIHAILLENIELKHCMEENLENYNSLLTGYNAYRNKMESYKRSISEMECQAPIHKELMEKRKEVKRLKECREELKRDLQDPEGNAIRQAQKEMDNIRAKIQAKKELVKDKSILLEKEKQIHSQLRKDIEIHNRRCEAILKRLRCQLNKAQSNHRQLSSDISDMEKEVEHLKNQLQVSHPM
ncbi:coiled-coil domain-containing protein 122 isoform X2 [Hoplias malabaricus]|uniref:coiled-coil domain-containing protein 122 isoform X2 n=1 Tax=Hoplias malabaricus TaxID=27720 RepID=UPI00346355BB